MRLSTALVLSLALAAVPSARAGVFDFLNSGSHPSIPQAEVESRLHEYMAEIVHTSSLKISKGRSDLTGAERKQLDRHILSRLDRAEELMVANVDGPGATGLVVLGSSGLTKTDWNPSRGFVGSIWLTSKAVFPSQADRALSLCAHLVGEPALYGFSPDAGPLWKVTERYLSQKDAFEGAPHFANNEGASAEEGAIVVYTPHRGEKSPGEDEIPAWVVRGLVDFTWNKQPKPFELGILLALTRHSAGVELTHVTGAGTLSQGLFRGAQRAEPRKEKEEE